MCPSGALLQTLASPGHLSSSDGVDVSNARRSLELMDLMRQQNIALGFSPISASQLCIVDATNNPTNAYKVRGALASVQEAQRQGFSEVIAASAGNHGAGVAYAAASMGLGAVVYVPQSAPRVKVEAIKKCGAQVVQVGATFDECLVAARENLQLRSGRAKFVHAFDSSTVVAGQGTIGVELLRHLSEVLPGTHFEKVRLFLPIGGGGLAAGVASAMKVLWPYRDVGLEIVGVVDEGVPASLLGMIAGRPISFGADTIADGTRVRRIGERFLEVSHLVDHILKVPHDEIVSAMRRYHQATGIKLEGAGALALAGEALGKRYDLFGSQESTLNLALVSGKNVDPATFDEAVNATKRLDTSVFMRKAFDVVIPERDGELLHLLQAVKDFNIAGLLYKQRSGASEGHLRIEFEVERARLDELAEIVEREFPGSHEINEGQQMLFEVGDALTAEFNDELIELSDRPGSFLRHVEMLSADGSFGSVGFLFYQKPMRPGLLPQVVIGRAADTAPAGNQEYAGVAFPVGW